MKKNIIISTANFSNAEILAMAHMVKDLCALILSDTADDHTIVIGVEVDPAPASKADPKVVSKTAN
jgi:hypothetical protein